MMWRRVQDALNRPRCGALAWLVIMSLYTTCTCAPVVGNSTCQRVDVSICKGEGEFVKLPNMFGHETQSDTEKALTLFLPGIVMNCSPYFKRFICGVFLPRCDGGDTATPVAPCRELCDAARDGCDELFEALGFSWPAELDCNSFTPGENSSHCLGLNDRVAYIPEINDQVDLPIPLPSDQELEDEALIEIIPISSSTDAHPRRYDIVDLGDPNYFQGWADVQGTGSPNDYCRVIGKGRRKFMSCALGGGRGQDHMFVSKLGLDAGHKNTWFMRDLDNDGRDDYCRCVGRPEKSRISCMKAGPKGFYGGIVQGGSQYSFDLAASSGCHNKKLNPFYGA